MGHTSAHKTPLIVGNVTIVLALSITLWRLFPYLHQFQIDPDEGINVMKSLLMTKGYALYSDIWSDQPPLFTVLLAAIFNIFGATVVNARLSVLAFSGMLLWSTWQFLKSTGGYFHAAAGIFMMLITPFFLQLSISVMIGLPAIALAMVAMSALVNWHKTHRQRWLIISSIAISLSALTKLFTGFLFIIFVGGVALSIIVGKVRQQRFPPFRSLLIQITVLVVVFGGGLWWANGFNYFDKLLETHIVVREMAFTTALPWQALFFGAEGMLFLAILGVMFAGINRQYIVLYAAAWLVAGSIVVAQQCPRLVSSSITGNDPCRRIGKLCNRRIF